MSAYAAQVVLHPVANQTLKVLATTVGRDKIYRTIQYFARFLAYYLLSRGNTSEAARWNALKNSLAVGRKLMRLVKPLEHLQLALKASQASNPHFAEQITTIGRQVAYAGYLTYDAIVWANTIRFIILPPATATKVTKTSQRFWLAGILFSLVNGLMKLGRLTTDLKRMRGGPMPYHDGEKNIGAEADRTAKMFALNGDRTATRYQLLIDLLDVWIPAAGLGLVNVNDGVLGVCGVVTSLMALRTQWWAVNN